MPMIINSYLAIYKYVLEIEVFYAEDGDMYAGRRLTEKICKQNV